MADRRSLAWPKGEFRMARTKSIRRSKLNDLFPPFAGEIDTLVKSVGEVGILSPLRGRWATEPERKSEPEAEVICLGGNQRHLAAEIVGLEEVPIFVAETDTRDDILYVVMDNQRVGRSWFTAYMGYFSAWRHLKETQGMSQEQVAVVLGVSQDIVSLAEAIIGPMEKSTVAAVYDAVVRPDGFQVTRDALKELARGLVSGERSWPLYNRAVRVALARRYDADAARGFALAVAGGIAPEEFSGQSSASAPPSRERLGLAHPEHQGRNGRPTSTGEKAGELPRASDPDYGIKWDQEVTHADVCMHQWDETIPLWGAFEPFQAYVSAIRVQPPHEGTSYPEWAEVRLVVPSFFAAVAACGAQSAVRQAGYFDLEIKDPGDYKDLLAALIEKAKQAKAEHWRQIEEEDAKESGRG